MKIFSVFLAVLLMVSLASVALARGAPSKDKSFSQAAVVEHVSPVVANVPPATTGFDVIQNLTRPAQPRLATANNYSDISAMTGLSTTGNERGFGSGSYSARSGPSPRLVMLA